MSRRARKYHPKPVHSNAVQIALARVKPLSGADVAGQTALVQHALQQFCQGINCDAHWCSLADTANMAETLAGMGLGSGDDATRVIELAQRALAELNATVQDMLATRFLPPAMQRPATELVLPGYALLR